MYHRFEENKYPSTNIRNEIFLEHLKEINNLGIEFCIDFFLANGTGKQEEFV